MSQNFLVNGLYPLEYFVLAGTDQIQYPHEFWWQSRMRYAREGVRGLSDANGNLTSEYLEIDLSRIRQVNYLNFSVIRAPLDITIQYDAVSDTDSDHRWVDVTPITDEKFDDQIHYSAAHRSPWHDVEFYFTDSQGHPINTRFIRIKFKRRDVGWPHTNAKPFRWSVMVRHLRPARFINHYRDTRGTLFDTGIPTGIENIDATHVLMNITDTQYATDAVTQSGWVKQQFGVPFDLARGSGVYPDMMGFSMLFFIEPNQPLNLYQDNPNESLVDLQWQLYDATNRAASPVLLKSGINKGALTDKRGWVNVYFDPEDVIDLSSDIATTTSSTVSTSPVYELWVRSLSVHADAGDGLGVRQVMGKFIEQDNKMVGQSLGMGVYAHFVASNQVAIYGDITNLVQAGDLIRRVDGINGAFEVSVDPAYVGGGTIVTFTTDLAADDSQDVTTEWERVLPIDADGTGWDYEHSSCMHVWADVADNGRDTLGNQYRYATIKDDANDVFDSGKGWLSEPQPSTNAVEALYFDTRYKDVDGHYQPGVIDAIRIGPATPGLLMHVYFTENHGSAIVPQTSTQWDRLIWQPIHTTYNLNGNATFTLPTTIRAAFVKLEFTKLQPRAIPGPARPVQPAVTFRRYPTWIENQFDNASVRRTVQDWFTDQKNNGLVKIDALKFAKNSILEFQYKEREFLAALATNKKQDKDARNSGLINTAKNTFIDPTTASKINVNTPRMFGAPLTLLVDRSSLLGQTIASQTDVRMRGSVREGGFEQSRGIPQVSTSNGRVSESFAHLAATPMWFNLAGRHIYKKDKAKFGKQAFYAGINTVEFLRKDYSQQRDDALITENLYDAFLAEENTWVIDKPSRIAQMVGTDSDLLNPGHDVNLLVTYTIDSVTTTDEPVLFSYFDEEVFLLGQGTTQAIGVQVHLANADGSRGQLFNPQQDYVLQFYTDSDTGGITNSIKINTPNVRLVVGHIAATYDAGIVVGKGVIGSLEVYDSFATADSEWVIINGDLGA
jgi:hypothetical protein